MKLLNVKKTSLREVARYWSGINIPPNWIETTLFIRSNAKGIVDWEVAPVYTCEELIERDNVTILK